jgi:Holliday junction resolvase RusA-like endonuclease
MSETIHLTIPLEMPSQNKTMRMHWSKRKAFDNRCGFFIRHAMAGNSTQANGRFAVVTIVAFRKVLIKDKANLIGGCKGFVDQLTKAGLLTDDSDDLCDIRYHQYQSKTPRTEVFITYDQPNAKGNMT